MSQTSRTKRTHRRGRQLAGLASAALTAAVSLGACTGPAAPAPDEGPVGTAEGRVQGCVTVKRGYFGTVTDAYISRSSLTTNNGSGTILIVDGSNEALIKFDLSFVPAGAVLQSATMNVYTNGTSGSSSIQVHNVLSAWNESTVTFNSFLQQYDPLNVGVIQPSSTNAQKSVDLTTLAKAWLNGSTTNHGVLLEASGGTSTVFIASEGRPPTNPAPGKIDPSTLRPELVLCYDDPVNHCAPNPCVNGTCQNGFQGYTCQCAPGWTGTNCDINIDDCAPAPCLNGGTCADGVNGYTCTCATGWTGTNCQTLINNCVPQPCQNGGVCTNGLNTYSCTCPPGFTGLLCEVNIDDCAGNPCQNGGTCADGVNGYTCTCATGYTGQDCQINIDDCATNACQNGALCIDGIASYTCSCLPGFTGTYCEVDIDDCAAAPCLNGGSCLDGVNGYTCSCAPGYTGTNCEIDINDCSPNPCLNGGVCVDGVNSYACQCPAGYAGTNCEINIDDCSPNPCLNGGACTDGINSFTCQCAAGFSGPTCATATCPSGFADCDGSAQNGCEANLKSDAANCGACGVSCAAGQICASSACISPPAVPGTRPPINASDVHGALAPAAADVNGDGLVDVLVANSEGNSTSAPAGTLSVRFGNGDGTLQGEAYYGTAPLASNAVVAADVNGDGWLDAITVNGQTNLNTTNGSISVYLNLGPSAPGVFGQPSTFTTGAAGSVHLCAADFNGDGKIDIATTSVSSNKVSVLFGNGNGTFGSPTLISIVNTGGVQSTIVAADLNADGQPDLVATSPSSARISVILNQGNGTFAAPVAYANALNGLTAGLAVGDFNGDGKLDIISNGAAGAFMYFFKGNGNGTLVNGVNYTVTGSQLANSGLGIVSGDFNGDGKLDAYVLRTATTGGVYPMTGNGAGAFSVGTLVQTGSAPGLNAVAVTDMDRDGYPDLVVTNTASATITVLLNSL